MNIFKRLLYYGFGVMLGIFMVIFLFGDRDIQCSYFPNDRVLYDLGKKDIQVSDNAQQQMSASQLDTSDIRTMLTAGNVNFDKSDREKDSCNTYWVDLKREENNSFSALFENCDSTVTVLQVAKL